MFKREYLLEHAQAKNLDLKEVWKRCVATKEENGPTVFFALKSSYYSLPESPEIKSAQKTNETPAY